MKWNAPIRWARVRDYYSDKWRRGAWGMLAGRRDRKDRIARRQADYTQAILDIQAMWESMP